MKPKIVILIYQSYLPHQGRYPRVSGQARILKEKGYDICVLGCNRDGSHPEREVLEGIPVERIRVKTGEMKGPIFQILPLILFYIKSFVWFYRKDYDIVDCHNLDVLPLGYLLKKVKGVKLIFDAHEPNYYALWPKKWRFLVKFAGKMDAFFSERADAVTVTNAYQVEKYKKVGVRRVELIGNYPIPELRISVRSVKTRSQNDLITFGRFGTLYPHIGIEETIEAFRRVVFLHPEARLLLGGRVVQSYEESLRELIAPFKAHVELMGAYDSKEIPKLYRGIDVSCLIYPKSDWFRNITPTKFFDSIANGVPVIMTDIGGLGDVIRKYRCGIVVDENDIQGICEALELLMKERSLLEVMSQNALDLANSEYDWGRLVETFTKVVREIHEQ